MNNSISKRKQHIRRNALSTIKSISSEAKQSASHTICNTLIVNASFRNSKNVFAYLNLASEPDLTELLFRHNKTWCFPRITGSEMEFYPMGSIRDSKLGSFNTREPNPDKCDNPIRPTEADVILIPGVAFSPITLDRLGRGKGYYDRYLDKVTTNHSGPKLVGIAFSQQLLDDLPVDPHDMPMDQIVTEITN